jgi:octanoyl-[GcvH]:protein N-octanoyltransferase
MRVIWSGLPEVSISPTPISGSAAEDHALSRDLLERVARREIDGALRIWTPVRALALSRLDELRPGAAAASAAAERAGVEVVRRVSGGHAVVLGRGSFCAGIAEPATTFEGTQQRYQRLSDAIVGALAELGIEAGLGELAGEWCPGTWSIRSGGVKLAGLAQRAIKGGAWAEAVIDLSPDPSARALLAEVYDALELPLDAATLGSVEEISGRPVSFAKLAGALQARLER